MNEKSVSRSTLARLPGYLTWLRSQNAPSVSAAVIAEALGLGEVQVRKDLASVCELGRPRVGYDSAELKRALEDYLGYNDLSGAVVVGCGKLGSALLDYGGFREYGMEILAGFDSDPAKSGRTPHGREIFPMEKLAELIPRLCVHVGALAVPAEAAQAACDAMCAAGVRAILNFAPAHLNAPPGVIIRNENLAASLAALANELRENPSERTK